MKNVSTRSLAALQSDEGSLVPEELIGRLRHASETTIIDLVERYTTRERANLAMFCYRKAHLRSIGLAIAATCDLSSLVQCWGTLLGQTIFTQSRGSSFDHNPLGPTHRNKITLARSAGRTRQPFFDIDDKPVSA